MNYHRSNTAQGEIRLLYFTQNSDSLAPSEAVEMEMKTVSLEDYTLKSQEYMRFHGCSSYDRDEYRWRNVEVTYRLIESNAEEATLHQIVGCDDIEEVMSSLDFGRWSWGDYCTLSYTWGDTSKIRLIKVNRYDV